MVCKYCDKGKEGVLIHESHCPEAHKEKFTDPFSDELCPKCREMHKSHAIISVFLACLNPTCGTIFLPKREAERRRKISGKIKWKR